jgi:hypothetical protein
VVSGEPGDPARQPPRRRCVASFGIGREIGVEGGSRRGDRGAVAALRIRQRSIFVE